MLSRKFAKKKATLRKGPLSKTGAGLFIVTGNYAKLREFRIINSIVWGK